MGQRDALEIRDVADGLWLWRQPHPAWREGDDWEPEVTSVAGESRGGRGLLDPLPPPPRARGGGGRPGAPHAGTIAVPKPRPHRDPHPFVRRDGGRPDR